MPLVETILQSITQLPPFPAVLQRILQLLKDPKTSAQDIVEVMQYDQSITANVLMVCNSAYFALRRPVSSIRDAVVRIGFNQLLEIILSRGSAYLFHRAYQGYDLETGELWRHSVACALLSQDLAPRLNKGENPVQFTAALLHDIGKIILSEFVKDNFQEIKRRVQEGNLSFNEAEKEVLGIDHAELGAKISEQWKFPPAITVGIQYHHTPLSAPADSDLPSLLYLCDMIALMTGIGGGADGLSYHAHNEVIKQYGLKGKDLEQIINHLQDRMSEVERILNMK
jgi:putative nucleotidyltransferase with HDIG domain